MSKEEKETVEEESQEPEVELKYPDGGWGWIIVTASGISNFITIPVMQAFALIFQKRIKELNMSTTDLSTIINVNAAFGMGLGLIAGPVLKKYGYRKVALFGAFSSFIGITATSWATSFAHFLVSYSLINSMGTFLLMSSFSIAINTYFLERRGYASGMSTTLTGLGPVIMPQVISFLLRTYDTQGTVLILGALSSHAILAALLLQPVEWHMRKVPIKVEEENNESKAVIVVEPSARKRKTSNSVDEADFDNLSLYGLETPIVVHRQFGSTQQMSKKRKSSAISYYRSVSQNDDVDNELTKRLSRIDNDKRKSGESINIGSLKKIVDDVEYQALSQGMKDKVDGKQLDSSTKFQSKLISNGQQNNKQSCDDEDDEEQKRPEPKSLLRRLGEFIVNFFGLDLLVDPQYVILVIGMSLAICAELNFSLFTPLILGDYGFDLQMIATIMSTVGINDIVFRFFAPFIGGKLKFTAQTMYLISLIMLITARTSLMLFHDYTSAIIVACGLGVAKGFRTVYMGLVIPNYLPLERLAHGSGIQSAVNCFFIVLSIPLMAVVRDRSGSYNLCIAALNCITAVTVIMWTVQLVYNKIAKKKQKTTSINGRWH